MVRVCDYAQHSLGIEIKTMVELPVNKHLLGSGVLSINGFTLKVSDTIISRLILVKSNRKNKTYTYKAGLKIKSTVKQDFLAYSRLSQRIRVEDFRISVNSCLAPDFEIQISLKDIATSGFRGSIIKQQDKQLLWSGCGLQLHATDLRGHVIEADKENIRVEWTLDGGDGEIQWSSLVSSQRNPEGDLSLANAEDLMETFVKSGSAAPEYLFQLPLIRSNTIRGLSQESQYPDWFFKWIERSQRGDVMGHIAGYRLADNLWCAGDLFSDPDIANKINPQFAKKFLEQFVDFLHRKSPTPKVYGAWKKSHPFWQQTEQFLANNPQTLFCDVNGTTFFTDPSKSILTSYKYYTREITFKDSLLFRNTAISLSNNGLLEYASAFDYDPDRLGSPRLRELFLRRKFSFYRKYLLYGTEDKSYFAVISRFPYGVSPYNNTSIVFALPLNGDGRDFSAIDAQSISLECGKLGIYPHRVVLIQRSDAKLVTSNLAVRTVIVQPRMWLNI